MEVGLHRCEWAQDNHWELTQWWWGPRALQELEEVEGLSLGGSVGAQP